MSSRYQINVPPTTELHRREIELRYNQLKDVWGTNERWMHGVDEVVAYMNECGIRQQQGREITKAILYRWRRYKSFPWGAFHEGRPKLNVSNLMIMAWIWSLPVYKRTKAYKPVTRNNADILAHLTS